MIRANLELGAKRVPIKLGIGLICAATLLVGTDAWAQPGKPSRAEILFREGRDAKSRGDKATACAKFEESVSLARAPGALMNLADCEEDKQHLLNASKLWAEAINALKEPDERLAPARKRASTLITKIPRVVVHVDPDDENVQLEVDGNPVPADKAGSPLLVDPGAHTIVAKSGERSGKTTVTIDAQERKDVTITLQGGSVQSSTLRTTGFVIGGVGVAGLIGFGVTAGLIQGYRGTIERECNAQKQCSDIGLEAVSSGQSLTPINTAALIVGAVGVSAGVTLVLLSSRKSPTPTSTAFHIGGAPNGFSASFSGTF